jgi:hypothetical protein
LTPHGRLLQVLPFRLVLLIFVGMLSARPAFAQMPFWTDDPGVAEPGMLHVEISNELDSLQSMQRPDLRQNTANFKVNFGLPYGLEFDIDAPYISIDRASGSPKSNGLGDTNLGVKWNIRDVTPDSRRPGFAVSFYTEFPTGDARQELGSGVTDYWLNFISQLPVSERTRFNLNLGILFAGNTSTGVVGIETKRGQVYVGGFSMLHDLSTRLTVGAEVFGGISDSSGLDRTQLQALLGAQYTIHDGVSLCLGFTAGTYTASPRFGALIGIAVDFPHVFHSRSQKLSRVTGSTLRDPF